MKKRIQYGSAIGLTMLVSGCMSPSINMVDIQEQLAKTAGAESIPQNIRVLNTHYSPGRDSPDVEEETSWLHNINITISEPRRPITLAELARAFNDQGVTIISSMPLSNFSYQGLGVKNLDAEKALYATFGTSGSDVLIDNEKKIVEIIPMPTRTWVVSAPPSTSSMTISSETEDDDSSSTSSASDSSSSSGVVALSKGSKESSKSEIVTESDFWESLSTEIGQRMTILLPRESANTGASDIDMLAMGMENRRGALARGQMVAADDQGPFYEVQVGKVGVNKDAGTVTVQAPRFILDQIDSHIKRIEGQLNAVISIRGLIFFVSENQVNQEGIDLSGFADFATDYGLALSNNALGGVTFSMPTAGSVGSYSAQSAVAGTGLGVVRKDNLLQAFNAYLESKGSVQTLQKPQLTATHGYPSTFSVYDTDYVNIVSEEVSSGDTTGNAAVARTNNLTPFQFGTSLRVLPRFNPDNNLVRAQIALTQTLESGSRSIGQVVGNTGGGFETLETAIPLDRRIDMAGEVIVESGSLVVFGGQRISSMNTNGKGVTGMKDSWLGGLFGSKRDDRNEALYYVALQVDVERPDKKVKVRAFSK